MNEIKKTVIQESDIDDPIIRDPIYLSGIDYVGNDLVLILSQPVNVKWIQTFISFDFRSCPIGKEPANFRVSSERGEARISARENEVPRIVDTFKGWLPRVNQLYERKIREERRQAMEDERRVLASRVDHEERRLRIPRSVKI